MKNRRIGKAISALALVACVLCSTLPVPFLASGIDTNGEASENEPAVDETTTIYLSTPEDVLELAENCRMNTWSLDKVVVLENDIDMTGVEFAGIPTFGGTFLGQGCTILGLYITNKGSNVGFFRYLQKTATIESLNLEGVVQPNGTKSVVGGIAGNNAGTIKECTVNITVSGDEQIGGFVGINATSGVIEGCTVNGIVYGNHFVGGIAGENTGVIRDCVNHAEINTKSVHNTVDIEDITLDTMVGTESADTATDIGGIAGISSGVIRACTNNGAVGYQSMGYNVGGIAGSQKGYLAECVNNADIKGRKEVGGIVGQMEPNMVIEYNTDSFQILSEQMQVLSGILKSMRKTLDAGSSDISAEIDALEKDVAAVQDALDIISEEFEGEEIDSSVDADRVIAALSDMTGSISDVFERVSKIQTTFSDTTSKVGKQLEEVVAQLDEIIGTVETMEDRLGFEVVDVSAEDTDEDTLGKVSNCINYGSVSGELNIGGIVGVLSEEIGLEAYEDIEFIGEESLYGAYRIRVVVRDCRNLGTIAASKQNVGGIAGQLVVGAVLESTNMGNMDAMSADYVGGIAGVSTGVIRSCMSKSMIAGDTYVGGIAGSAKKVTDCYAFVSIEAYEEKAGAIVGCTEVLPEGTEEDTIAGNYYFLSGNDVGGIDGISYAGATERVDLATFLQLPDIDEALRTVSIRFVAEGLEDVVISVNVGGSLAMDAIPKLEVEADSEYTWAIVSAVTSESLGMGETASVEYISEERLTNILFDQTYEAVYDLKSTVIQGTEKNENNLSVILAVGVFANDTVIEMEQELSDSLKATVDAQNVIISWRVTLSSTGVSKLHYLIPEDVYSDYVKLYVQDASGNWAEREFVVDGSYVIFEFVDGETGFALVEDYSELIQTVLIIVIVLAVLLAIIVTTIVVKKIRKKR